MDNSLLLLLIILLLCLNKNKLYESYYNCPNNIVNLNHKLQTLLKKSKNNPMRGYTKNEYLYKMEILESKDPLPVNANFFLNKY